MSLALYLMLVHSRVFISLHRVYLRCICSEGDNECLICVDFVDRTRIYVHLSIQNIIFVHIFAQGCVKALCAPGKMLVSGSTDESLR